MTAEENSNLVTPVTPGLSPAALRAGLFPFTDCSLPYHMCRMRCVNLVPYDMRYVTEYAMREPGALWYAIRELSHEKFGVSFRLVFRMGVVCDAWTWCPIICDTEQSFMKCSAFQRPVRSNVVECVLAIRDLQRWLSLAHTATVTQHCASLWMLLSSLLLLIGDACQVWRTYTTSFTIASPSMSSVIQCLFVRRAWVACLKACTSKPCYARKYWHRVAQTLKVIASQSCSLQ